MISNMMSAYRQRMIINRKRFENKLEAEQQQQANKHELELFHDEKRIKKIHSHFLEKITEDIEQQEDISPLDQAKTSAFLGVYLNMAELELLSSWIDEAGDIRKKITTLLSKTKDSSFDVNSIDSLLSEYSDNKGELAYVLMFMHNLMDNDSESKDPNHFISPEKKQMLANYVNQKLLTLYTSSSQEMTTFFSLTNYLSTKEFTPTQLNTFSILASNEDFSGSVIELAYLLDRKGFKFDDFLGAKFVSLFIISSMQSICELEKSKMATRFTWESKALIVEIYKKEHMLMLLNTTISLLTNAIPLLK